MFFEVRFEICNEILDEILPSILHDTHGGTVTINAH